MRQIADDEPLRQLQQTTWRVVVIGAGPAGGVAAAMLAGQGGRRVLLVEKSIWPREKVCGGCLNHSAIQTLRQAGLAHTIARGQYLDRAEWRCGQRAIAVPMPLGVAMARSELDATLVAEAERRGCTFISGVSASVLPDSTRGSHRSILLRRGEDSAVVKAEAVLACDGIGGTSVQSEPWAKWKIARRGWIGVAATFDEIGGQDVPAIESQKDTVSGLHPGCHRSSIHRRPVRQRLSTSLGVPRPAAPDKCAGVGYLNATKRHPVPPGAICMHIGEGGYVGLVRMPDGRIHLAAALDPRRCRQGGGPGRMIAAILESTGISIGSALDSARLHGTGIMTRQRIASGGHRVLAVGDACGYVEPFTGEGMAWAMRSAATVIDMLPGPGKDWPAQLAARWEAEHRAAVGPRQRWCRLARPIVHHPRLSAGLIGLGSLLPWISRGMAEHVCGVEESLA